MASELRLTDTNAASDSTGRTWGLEGNLFWWLVGGLLASIALFCLQVVILKVSLATSLVVAAVPAVLCLAYVFGLRQGKPPGYDGDFLAYRLGGGGFAPDLDHPPIHPLDS